MKILSPAGNFESLKMAVLNGADEVYLGINDFNARNNIDGFTLATLKEGVAFAHIFDVKVLLAINILFKDEELQSALDTIVEANNLGVDAFIVQDLALAKIVKENFPSIELHASTQMGLHNLEGVQVVEKLGFKRVVLARETPLEEIKRIKENSSVEIEYFAHGALCVSFSGNCYLSSHFCGASGNRGKCKQLCRLPYTLKKDDKVLKKGFLLSAKDFNMLSKLDELKNAGVDVLKIEGRARRPFYVATATREYRNALDGKGANEESLALAFNRTFTPGYFEGNGKIISKLQNHIGIFVGKVEKVVFGKKFSEVIFSSTKTLSPKSTFKFFSNGKEMAVISAYDLKQVQKNKYKITTTQRVSVGDEVRLIVDAAMEEQMTKISKRRSVKINLLANVNKNIKAKIMLGNKEVEVEGEVCQQAIKQPITKEMIEQNFDKSELFEGQIAFESFDNIFMPMKALNEFRRNVYEKIYEYFATAKNQILEKQKVEASKDFISFDNFQIVENLEEKMLAQNIIYSPEEYNCEKIEKFIEACKKSGKQPYLDTPNFALEKDIELLKNIIQKTKISIVANNYYALSFDCDKVIGAGLNVYNTVTASLYPYPILSCESGLGGRVKFPYMTLRHCPMKNNLNATCDKCPYAKGYKYIMDDGRELLLSRKKLSSCTFYLNEIWFPAWFSPFVVIIFFLQR